MKALLIIDMQNAGFPQSVYRYDAEGVIERINKLSAAIRATGNKVIFVQHDGTAEGEFIPGTQDWKIIDALQQEHGDSYVAKTANDAFYKSLLKGMLDEFGVKELFITGWATDYCVDATIRSALSNDYDITVVSDAHTCGNRPYLEAEKVIVHHNYTWANMIPTMGKIAVADTATVLRLL